MQTLFTKDELNEDRTIKKIRSCITDKSTAFDRLRQKAIEELQKR